MSRFPSIRPGALALALALTVAAACAEEQPAEQAGPPRPLIEEAGPPGFPPMLVPEDNPSTPEGIALGRKLYYDLRLSPDGSRACASCHVQQHSFSSTAAVGVLPHVNLAWSRYFLWDGHFEGTLEETMTMEVEDFFQTDVARLREPDLEAMFLAAFGSPEITTQRAAYALAQFERSLVSSRSRFDRYADGKATLTGDELRGMALFYSERAECFHCHATRLFTDNLFHNNGLDVDRSGTGRAGYTGRPEDDGLFKTPTLRNVARTAPYMHDDRFATLEEVVDFYSEGIAYSRTVDTLVSNVSGGGMQLTAQERAELVAFLRTLTDEEFLADPALAPPP